MKILALRICSDTAASYRDGVPPLLDALDELSVKGSFFFGMGTEDDGSMMSRLFHENRDIIGTAPGIIRDAHRRGHDCGIHGWNPREWAARLDRMKDTTLDSGLKRAVEIFVQRTGARPNGCAAPGFRASYISLRIQDELRLSYCCDSLGYYPFLPKLSWKTFSTPQIPSTYPPLEAVLRKASESEVRSRLAELYSSLPDGLSVVPMNASVGAQPEIIRPLRDFLSGCVETGVRIVTLHRVITSIDVQSLPQCEIVPAQAFGMTGDISLQKIDQKGASI